MTDGSTRLALLEPTSEVAGAGWLQLSGGAEVFWSEVGIRLVVDGHEAAIKTSELCPIQVGRSASYQWPLALRWLGLGKRADEFAHVELRSSAGRKLSFQSVTDPSLLEGLPWLDSEGVELAYDELKVVLGAAQKLGATVAHWSAEAALEDHPPRPRTRRPRGWVDLSMPSPRRVPFSVRSALYLSQLTLGTWLCFLVTLGAAAPIGFRADLSWTWESGPTGQVEGLIHRSRSVAMHQNDEGESIGIYGYDYTYQVGAEVFQGTSYADGVFRPGELDTSVELNRPGRALYSLADPASSKLVNQRGGVYPAEMLWILILPLVALFVLTVTYVVVGRRVTLLRWGEVVPGALEASADGLAQRLVYRFETRSGEVGHLSALVGDKPTAPILVRTKRPRTARLLRNLPTSLRVEETSYRVLPRHGAAFWLRLTPLLLGGVAVAVWIATIRTWV